MSRLNSLETIIRDQPITTRENTSKALRECLCIEHSMHEKTCKQLQLANEGISAVRDKTSGGPHADVRDFGTCQLSAIVPSDYNACCSAIICDGRAAATTAEATAITATK